MAILGIDEVGRGPWAGPLVIGAVVLPERFDANKKPILEQAWQDELADSKKLTSKKREKLEPIIKENAVAFGLGWASASELDEIGLSEALKLATRRAVCSLLKIEQAQENEPLEDQPPKIQTENALKNSPKNLPFSEIIIDGTSNFLKGTDLENLVSVLPKADTKIKAVSAASIIAKVARDNYMKNLAEKYPGYGFEKHVGYGTAVHKSALESLGPCPEHRQSFRPVVRTLDFAGSPRQRERTIGSPPVTTGRATGARKTSVRTAGVYAGRKAESVVAAYLARRGHKILSRNYKTKYYEIDIVSATKDHIYFTEVKYRKDESHGSPLNMIDKAKQRQITFAANAFMKFLSKKLDRDLDSLPSPILAAAAVEGPDFKLQTWTPLN